MVACAYLVRLCHVQIPSRAFRRWGCKVFGGTRAEARERDPEPAGALVSEVYHNLLLVGKKFAQPEFEDDVRPSMPTYNQCTAPPCSACAVCGSQVQRRAWHGGSIYTA